MINSSFKSIRLPLVTVNEGSAITKSENWLAIGLSDMFTSPSLIGSAGPPEKKNTPVKIRGKSIEKKIDCLLRKNIFRKTLARCN